MPIKVHLGPFLGVGIVPAQNFHGLSAREVDPLCPGRNGPCWPVPYTLLTLDLGTRQNSPFVSVMLVRRFRLNRGPREDGAIFSRWD
ncbi:hypothetical protein P168DRAFT_292865 [Aspergillus campestris IBT 28561]|uniref:Uncharacterized protein n=1 Tax=Aspergillus campestris (strain IBT 28561) TaxID=1392248 RepID=A0A2I1CW14_ASPC2|nr:uncharacterized protein P168DRAFT_292865 [Aspergillus campestris IBT 28561]PKY01798.1 hypothetical protein P168DRAFT_292865 [Aspergillus campestris IBT 28561]